MLLTLTIVGLGKIGVRIGPHLITKHSQGEALAAGSPPASKSLKVRGCNKKRIACCVLYIVMNHQKSHYQTGGTGPDGLVSE